MFYWEIQNPDFPIEITLTLTLNGVRRLKSIDNYIVYFRLWWQFQRRSKPKCIMRRWWNTNKRGYFYVSCANLAHTTHHAKKNSRGCHFPMPCVLTCQNITYLHIILHFTNGNLGIITTPRISVMFNPPCWFRIAVLEPSSNLLRRRAGL